MGRIEYKTKKSFDMRAYKFKELAALYKVSCPTLRKWLLEISAKITRSGGYYTIPQVEEIVKLLGIPYMIYDIDHEETGDDRKEFQKPFEVRAYKWKELCQLYSVCPRTLKRWIAPFAAQVGQLDGGYFKIPQIEAIIKHIGLPYQIEQSIGDSQQPIKAA
jgi:hypothetical protein